MRSLWPAPFRKAAERLNKSQSAVSHAIRQLEDELELKLFSRDGYRPKLTAQGEVFFRETSRALAQMQALGEIAARLRAREEAELRIAVTATLPLERLLPVLEEIGRRFAATHLRLSTEMMGGAIARLMEGNADLAVATLDGVPMDAVETRRMADVTIRPVASRLLADRLGSDAKSAAGCRPFRKSSLQVPGDRKATKAVTCCQEGANGRCRISLQRNRLS